MSASRNFQNTFFAGFFLALLDRARRVMYKNVISMDWKDKMTEQPGLPWLDLHIDMIAFKRVPSKDINPP